MKIDKAIEILQRPGVSWEQEHPEEHYAAERLGIEALKVIRDVRPTEYGAIDDPLPGETPE